MVLETAALPKKSREPTIHSSIGKIDPRFSRRLILDDFWTSPHLAHFFGKLRLHLSGKTEHDIKKTNMVMNYVLSHALFFSSTYLKVTGVSVGLMAGFWNWLGFMMPVTLGQQLWEGKSWKLFLVNGGHQLVGLCIMGIILAVWQ